MLNKVAHIGEAEESLLDDELVILCPALLVPSVLVLRGMFFVKLNLINCFANDLLQSGKQASVNDQLGIFWLVKQVSLNVQVTDCIQSHQIDLVLQLVRQFHHSCDRFYKNERLCQQMPEPVCIYCTY